MAQSVPSAWRVAGVLDLNNDGNLDILWQNRTSGDLYYWLMNGAKMVSSGYLNHAPLSTPDWQVVGTGDLNGDGNTDLVWQNQKTGDVYYWLMDGLKKIGEGYLAVHPQMDWRIAGVADLNGDGHPDLLWQNRTTGAVYYWLMNGTMKAFGDTLPVSAGPDWRLLGAAHLNSVGKLDLLWRNQKTGDLTYTQMNGIQAEASGTIASRVPLDWELSGF
jgi:VCBS repeat protein